MNDPGERTCYVCGLHESVTEELLKELFSQVCRLCLLVTTSSTKLGC